MRHQDPTPQQTVGPFFHFCLVPDPGSVAMSEDDSAIAVCGVLYDGDDEPVPDALIELWQANAAGRYPPPADKRSDLPLDPAFSGFERLHTGPEGEFEFETLKPGPVPDSQGRMQAPHLFVAVFARGLLKHLVTRMYFPDEAEANDSDPILGLVDPPRRSRLIAEPAGSALQFMIHLQGQQETPFFDV